MSKLIAYFSHSHIRDGRKFECWAVMRDGKHIPPVVIDYDLEWWSREGSGADLKAMALAKAEARE